MARFVYPVKFDRQVVLFKSIKKKHDYDGAGSVLIAFLSENNIDLNNDDADADNASSRHSEFEELSRLTEALREQRDNTIKLPWKHMRQCAQFLKALYADNARKLGEWNLTVNNVSRIVYPKKFDERAKLAKSFIAKHNSYAPGTSPLQIFLAENEIDFTDDLAAVTAAENLHDEFGDASRSKEEKREGRDVLWKPVWKNVKDTAAWLKTLFNNNPHRAGDYGITVDSSKRKPRLRRSTLLSGKSITIKGVAVGSTFTNHGKGVLHLLKSRKKSAEAIIISSNQQFKIPKGYANMTIYNPSGSENGVFSSYFHK